jgi:hypothetical protein
MKSFSVASNKVVSWFCVEVEHHKWTCGINSRAESTGKCVFCSGKRVCLVDGCNSLWAARPALRAEWHPSNPDMKTLAPNSIFKVKWVCSRDHHHIWIATPNKRVSAGTKCPICENQTICQADYCNSAYVLAPQLREEWDEVRNGDMRHVAPRNHKLFWWLCSKVPHHAWQSILSNRTGANQNGCPICSRRLICTLDYCTSLNVTHPELSDEWDEAVNGLMNLYLSGSHDKVSWICRRNPDHKWVAEINSRTQVSQQHGCPYCTYKSEDCARTIFRELFPTSEWTKVRLACLDFLELDGYCEELSVAWEYDGKQHVQEVPHFHRTPTAFREQQERDVRKNRLCAQHGIYLIRIPHTFTHNDAPAMRAYIEDQVDAWRTTITKRHRG